MAGMVAVRTVYAVASGEYEDYRVHRLYWTRAAAVAALREHLTRELAELDADQCSIYSYGKGSADYRSLAWLMKERQALEEAYLRADVLGHSYARRPAWVEKHKLVLPGHARRWDRRPGASPSGDVVA